MRPVQAARGEGAPSPTHSATTLSLQGPRSDGPSIPVSQKDPALHPGLKDALPLLTDLVPCLELTIRKIDPSSPENLTKMTPRLQRSQDSS